MAWDVTVPDTLAESPLSSTAAEQGATAKQAAGYNTAKYQGLEKTHIFFPIAIETSEKLPSCFRYCPWLITGEMRPHL